MLHLTFSNFENGRDVNAHSMLDRVESCVLFQFAGKYVGKYKDAVKMLPCIVETNYYITSHSWSEIEFG